MSKKQPPATELLDALTWLEGAGVGGAQRALSIRSTGDSDFLIKYFENAIARKEIVIKGVYAFRRALKVVGKSLPEGDDE